MFAGDAEETNGANIILCPDRLEDSVNYKSALAGLAYPTYYSGLFSELRNKIASAVNKAQKGHGKGIWAQDKTSKGFIVSSLASVTDEEVILPKLFRRIVNFMGDGGSIGGFKDYLAANPDPVLELKTGHFTNLDTFVEVTRGIRSNSLSNPKAWYLSKSRKTPAAIAMQRSIITIRMGCKT